MQGDSPKKGNSLRPVLIEFTTKIIRDRIYESRKMFKTSHESTEPKIFINENLTKVNANLYFCARKLVKNKKLAAAWTTNGYVYVKADQDPNARAKRITHLSDLECQGPYILASSIQVTLKDS